MPVAQEAGDTVEDRGPLVRGQRRLERARGGVDCPPGVVGAGFLGVYPGLDFEILPYAFVVVIVGGLGSLPGAMVGSLLVGLLDNFGKALFPELSYFTLFAPMALILALKPTGLFGRA